MKSPLTTLCYLEQNGYYLMLHRNKKKNDANHEKWIGIGGHFEEGESPEDCLVREVKEETGLQLLSFRFRGLVTFVSDRWDTEYMCLYTGSATADGSLPDTECGSGPSSVPAAPGTMLFSVTEPSGTKPASGAAYACPEGELKWIAKDEIESLNLWEGDRIFLRLLAREAPFFSLKLCYKGDHLEEAFLDGAKLKL